MIHSLQIDQQRSIERGFSPSQSIVFDFITKSPLRATVTTLDGVARWRFDVAKLPIYLPLVSVKKNTFQVIIQQLIKIGVIERIIIGGRDAYFKITEKGKQRNNIDLNNDGFKSTDRGIESTHRGFKSIVKNKGSALEATKSTMDLNPPAILYNIDNNNIYRDNNNIINNNDSIINNDYNNKLIINNNTDAEILKNENKEKISEYLKLYRDTLDSFGLIYVGKKIKNDGGNTLSDSVAMSNIIRSKSINDLIVKMGRTFEEFIKNILIEAIKDKYYITRISSVRGFTEVWGEIYNKTIGKNFSKPLSSLRAI